MYPINWYKNIGLVLHLESNSEPKKAVNLEAEPSSRAVPLA